MLLELRIKGYAVIDDLTLTLGPGLSALTGETGAGKSIIVGALSLLLGERAASDVVRVGADRAVIEGVFDVSGQREVLERLESHGMAADDGLLILKREVQPEGRNRAWISGSPATARMVGQLASALVDLHGQHEHQALLRGEEQRRILDAFAGLTEPAVEVRRLHQALARSREALEEREARRKELDARADFLRFQLAEIEDAQIQEDEEVRLEEEVRRLEHARELGEEAARLHEALYGGEDALSDRLAEQRAALERLARLDRALAEDVSALEAAYHQVADVGRRLGDYASGVEHDPGQLEHVRRRQDVLFRLKRKYGPGLAEVLGTARRVRGELEELERAALDLEGLLRQMESDRAALVAAAGALSAARAEAAGRLAEQVRAAFPEIGLEGGRFEIRLSPYAEPGPGGAEGVEYLASANPGFEPRPLARIASGGELSRVMLALKSILAGVDRVPTLVFDEIDAGVGGVVAGGVAAKLSKVAEHHQVFVVTHLPQLASRARAHLLVEKGVEDGRAVTRVTAIAGEERVREIARMLGGDPESARSREHARELLG